MSDAALSLKVSPLHRTLKAGSASSEYVLLQITAPKEAQGERPRLNAVLVLDVSGSMQGEPLAHVIRSAQRMADLLGEEDGLGVVAFDQAARQVSPLRKLSPEARRQMQQEVGALRAGGSTNLSGGLAHAALLFPPQSEGARQIALVMSDGHPNVGARTKEELAAEVALLRKREIAVSTLGFGAHHNEEILLGVAEAGGGRYAFVSEPRLADASFARALGAQRDVVADQVRLILRPAPKVEIVRVLGDPKVSFSAEGLQIELQDLILGDELNILVELKVNTGEEEGARSLLTAILRARQVTTREEEETGKEATVTVSAGTEEAPDAEVQMHVTIALCAEMRLSAQKLADQQNFSGAKAILEKAKALIENTPGFTLGEDTPLNDAWETLVDDISAMERNPDPEEYSAFKKSQRDYLDFAVSGATARQGGFSMSPSARLMANRLQEGPLPKARLWVTEKGGTPRAIPLESPEINIGRVQGNEIVLPRASVSKRNTRIIFSEGAFWVVDLKSTNGTYINGKKVAQNHRLSHGDRITIGDFEIRFEEME